MSSDDDEVKEYDHQEKGQDNMPVEFLEGEPSSSRLIKHITGSFYQRVMLFASSLQSM